MTVDQKEIMNTRKNILIGRTDVSLSGPGIVMLTTSSELIKKGYSVTVVSSGGALEDEFVSSGVNVLRIDELAIAKRSILSTLKAIRSIRKIIIDCDIHIVHGQNMFFTLLAYSASKTVRANVEFFTTIHGYGKEWLCKYLPGKIVVVSDFLKTRLLEFGVKKEKILILKNGFITETHLNHERYPATDSRGRFRIISVGMMTGNKGHDQAIETVKRIVSLGHNVELIFVGDGTEKERLTMKVKELKLQNNITFLGKRRDVPRLLAQADLFLHLTELETFGMVITEAMAARLPVIASNIGGIPELVDDGKNGYLVVNSNYDNIVEKVLYLIANKNKRDEFGINGAEKIKTGFLLEKTILRLEKIYKSGSI